ncbi:MAG: DNA methyltransferase, partial [Bacteroidota bacterium]|nr:DNA methyltransferase [Bacteroidota bacterium]
IMGVPISFLDKYNPGQFEIVGVDYDVKTGLLKWLINPNWAGKIDRGYINGKRCYARILIRHKSFS